MMAQKQKIGKNSTPTNTDPGYIIPMAITGHNSPADLTIELFKPSKDRKNLVVCNNKKLF